MFNPRQCVLMARPAQSVIALLLALAPLPTRGAGGAAKDPSETITAEQIQSITFEDAREDRGYVAPVAQNLDHLDDAALDRLETFEVKLDEWRPGKEGPLGQRVRNLIAVATLADLGRSEFEAETAFVIFDRLLKEVPKDRLARAAAWVVLKPREGTVVTTAKELGMDGQVAEADVRERSVLYAKKLLGRALGKLPAKRAE